MGKYAKKKSKKKSSGKGTRITLVAAIVAVLMLIALMLAVMWGLDLRSVPELPTQTDPTQASALRDSTEPTVPGQVYVPTVPQEEAETQPADNMEVDFSAGEVLELGKDLRITKIGSYAGIYMEDGSGEVLSDVLMITLENASERDLQLARITLDYTDIQAEFEATNIPAGGSVVLLEKSRQPYVAEGFRSARLVNAAFFPDPMSLMTERLEVTGMEGVLNVKNISGTDITGDIYVYYKHSAQGVFYGGITYRTKVSGGLAVGEIKQITAVHYDPVNCQIVAVTGGA